MAMVMVVVMMMDGGCGSGGGGDGAPASTSFAGKCDVSAGTYGDGDGQNVKRNGNQMHTCPAIRAIRTCGDDFGDGDGDGDGDGESRYIPLVAWRLK